MANEPIIQWHIAGLHALRSASEQGQESAETLVDKATLTEVREIVTAFGQLAARHEAKIAGFLNEFGVQPNDFEDQIMKGVGKGRSEMIAAAPDDVTRDLSLIGGNQSGIDYYRGAFRGQGSLAKKLGHGEQGASFMAMAEAWDALGERYTAVGETVRAQGAASVGETV
ncbi:MULTISPECIES: hypothetical protein [unclassified Sphingomonas]|uniref:hypothetical protein n=1 Tax=unclassified Sphingomonas TaxID=196159 RepID=UPI0006F5327F|nr:MULTISPECIES: hypothetical protein [unclassified Sphingomonas]KQM61904.1 hypothetical protein ASE65_06835 [Sphingomonas sp. Leaf16]KQN13177.1 hypothetical protein ASE81_07850 [Sphingomonas sp. Leaf29]KQN20062.1 hypothetical protein ASE83_07775 [Sphingomonas sp. Leaf32]